MTAQGERARSSRRRYLEFVESYRKHQLDEPVEKTSKAAAGAAKAGSEEELPRGSRAKRRRYLREYLRRLWPHRYAALVVLGLALLGAGLEMIEPPFMRFIVDDKIGVPAD
jgi:ATP-binding cassette subfamily B protein/subfamily B ATP-binding cassette protein MsbA